MHHWTTKKSKFPHLLQRERLRAFEKRRNKNTMVILLLPVRLINEKKFKTTIGFPFKKKQKKKRDTIRSGMLILCYES